MSDMRCTSCGMVMEAGKSYGYACPTASRCAFVPAEPVAPVTLPPMIGTRDAELTARIAALDAYVARLGRVNASLANDVVQAGLLFSRLCH